MCTAIEHGNSDTMEFFIDFHPNSMTVDFNEDVSGVPGVLNFNVVFATHVGDTHIIAAHSTGTQMVEIHFDKTTGWMVEGRMQVGSIIDRNMEIDSKTRSFEIRCR